MIPTKFRWQQSLLTDWDQMSNLHRGHSIDASYQVSVHLTKRFQRRRFLKIGHSETRIVCGGHVWQWIITKCALFREDLPQMLSTKVQFIWERFQGRRLKISTNQKQELPVAAMFVNRSGQMCNLQRGPSIDTSYQVSIQLAEGFQRRLKCEKQLKPNDGKSSPCLWQG